MFEMLVGYPPFCSETQRDTYHKIIHHRQYLPAVISEAVAEGANIQPHARDLLEKFLCEAPYRIGINGIDEIKSHPFFNGINWDSLRQSKAPIIPVVTSPTDTQNFDHYEDDNKFVEVEPMQPMHRRKVRPFDLPFIGYTYRQFGTIGTNSIGPGFVRESGIESSAE